ncbi:uncharacterized protein J4E78_004118 [Alternaria triticimaculans]|uniref:uncharacterized protein n=1 Tax=Alternaria triticimaculans TaxID=297637 RepID=UPI0020C46CFD|nr:uncharacterized protein J4E78_004118 [Alternaria triticimaculans]KAI4663701.1 hypothetical protein J4E78_004118 [Alternaria triticimaculans]
MDNEIRPAWQSPTFAPNSPGTGRDSWKTAPGSPREDFRFNVDAISEECETNSSEVQKSSRQPYVPRWECNEKLDYVEHDPDIDGIDWRPGFKHQFPWIGFAGLVVIFVATATAVAILVCSHKKRVKDWPFTSFPAQPNVLLNIANQIQNLGLITLVSHGLAIAWWRTALRGSSLRVLHKNHAYSYSFYAIVTSGRYFNLVALAALMTKFAVVDSTLFQKSTRTIVTQQKEYANSTMTAWVERDWPKRLGGLPAQDGTTRLNLASWAGVLDAYNGKLANGKVHDGLNDTASFFECPYRQECSSAVEGLGFAFNCTSDYQQVDYGLEEPGSYPLWHVNFNPQWATETKSYASINLEMLYVDSRTGGDDSCPGRKTTRTCEIIPAVVQYPVTVMVPSKEELDGKNIVTHIKFFNTEDPRPIGANLNGIRQIDGLKVLKTVSLDERINDPSTVGSLTYIMNNLYGSSANLTYDNGWDLSSRGASTQTTFYSDNDEVMKDACWFNINKPGRDDPTIEMLRKLNTLSFVTALYIKGAPKTDRDERKALGMASQNITTSITGIVEEYLTSSAYVYGALAATFITVILVLPVYWGFWQLGRKVTLGPLEISQAFGAPIIAPDKMKAYHGDFDQVLEDVGDRRVQYGQLRNAPPGQMGLAEPERVVVPKASHRWRVSGQRENRRIGLGAVFGGAVAATMSGNARD